MKILMIGPSKSDNQNYGLGMATENIAKQLGARTKLTIVSPVVASQIVGKNNQEYINVAVEESLLDAKSVDATAVQINIESILTPYFYNSPQQKKHTEVTDSSVEIQQALQIYNQTVVKQVAQLDFDIIYAHDWLSIGAAIQLKTKFSKPFVLHIHALDYDRVGKKTDSWIYKLEKEGMEKADVVVAVSHYHADIIHRIYKIEKEKIKVVHLASEAIKSRKYKSPFDEDIILFAGRLSQQKGIFTFIDIAEALIKTHKHLRFVIAGDGELAQEMVSKISERGLAAYFNFTGLLENEALQALMKESKILVVPSISEPFGLVAMEAAINELPIVISSRSGASEILKDSFIPKEETLDSYLEQVKIVLSNEPLVSKAVARNKEAATLRNWDNVGDEILEILASYNE